MLLNSWFHFSQAVFVEVGRKDSLLFVQEIIQMCESSRKGEKRAEWGWTSIRKDGHLSRQNPREREKVRQAR